MPVYEVTGPNGKTYEVNAPEGASEAQVMAYVKQNVAKVKSIPKTKTQIEAERLKAQRDKLHGRAGFKDLITHGATFGLTDEASGLGNVFMNAIKAPFSSKVDFDPKAAYAAGKEAEKMRLAEARSRTGRAGTVAEVAGGFVGAGPGKAIEAAPTLFRRMAQSGKPAAVVSAIGGFGYGEGAKESAIGAVGGGVLGYGLGAASVPVVESIGRGARYVAGKAAPVLSRMAGAASDTMTDVAGRLGIKPTPATTGGPVSEVTQMALGNVPGGSSAVAKGVQRETDDLAAAARRTAERLGPISSRQGAGGTVARGAKAFERASKTKGGSLYRQRTELIGGENAPVLMGSSSKEIRTFSDDFPNTPLLASIREHPAVRKLGEALPEGAQPEITLNEATEALSHIRGALRNAERSNTVTPAIKARIARVEQALEDDVMRAAQAADVIAGRAGKGSAVAAQREADAFWANRSNVLNNALKRPISSAKDAAAVSGESVYNQLIGDMQRKGGNLARLRQTWTNIPKNARNTFSATAFDDLGRATAGAQDATGSQWSFNTFLTRYNDMAPEARAIVFGGKGVERDIADIARYASRLRDIDRTRNFSNTARNTIAGAYLATVGGALWQGDFETALKVAVSVPAVWAGGRLFMSTPAMRQWTKQALGLLARGNTNAAPYRTLTARLSAIASQHPEIRAEVTQLQRHLLSGANDNIGIRAAAGDAEKDQQKQQ